MKLATIAFILLLLGASSALAHTLVAPDTVVAGPDGSFKYTWVFTAVGDTATVGDRGWAGIRNASPGIMVDCGCLCHVAPGQTVTFEVSGNLTRSSRKGLVQNWLDNCRDFTYENSTVILPFIHRIAAIGTYGAAPTQPVTWGSVKARFRGPKMAPAPF